MELNDMEALERAEARVDLPFGRLLLLYLYPFAFFKDANRGPAHEKRRALFYNRARRWMLLAYARRWTFIAATFYLMLVPVEALAKVPAAAFGVVCCLSLAVAACTLGAYVILGAPVRAD